MTTYRLAIADFFYVKIATFEAVCLMDGGREKALDGLQLGDRILYYSPSFKHGDEGINSYTAIGTITGQRLRKTQWPEVKNFAAWVMPCTFQCSMPFAEPLDYSAPVMDIDAGEFHRIAAAMGAT